MTPFCVLNTTKNMLQIMSLAAYASKTKKRLVIKNMQDSLANEHFRVKYTCKSCVQHHLAEEINLESGFHVILKVHDLPI